MILRLVPQKNGEWWNKHPTNSGRNGIPIGFGYCRSIKEIIQRLRRALEEGV